MNDAELWAYDEPHEFGGNSHVTMTRRQAIDWMRSVYPDYANRDEGYTFDDWKSLHWAYREPTEAPSASQ